MKQIKLKNLQTLAMILFMATALFGCSEMTNPNIDISKNEQQKEAVFNQILDDSELFNEFMDKMMDNSGAIHQMMMNESMMQHMFDHDNMQMMQQMNPEMMQTMMDNMMQMAGSDSSFQHKMMENPNFQNMMQSRDGNMDMPH
jgi:hypothetical protein